MGDGPIQPIIQLTTIDTMLSNNGLNIDDWLNDITCERSFKHFINCVEFILLCKKLHRNQTYFA